MVKLYSNPWKDRIGFKSKVKYAVRNKFYRWLLKKYCGDCKTVLDVACGPGHFMKVSEGMGFKAYGVEMDERYKAKNVFIKDLWKFNRKFDVVFNSFILEHMEDHQKFVNKMASLSNNIVITITAYLSKEFYNVPDHTKPATKVGIRWMFRRTGFRNLLSIHVPFYHAVVVVSKKVTPKDKDRESVLIRKGFW
ncbi:MAG TPA: methyltransferase domain-containing protein [Candidatus Nanoarchaeia archaeon]|nr:methyltransferase domain-containing protein [Candidatus Nanoarchaeia archaeon]